MKKRVLTALLAVIMVVSLGNSLCPGGWFNAAGG